MATTQIGPDDVVNGRDLLTFGNAVVDSAIEYRVYGHIQSWGVSYSKFIYYFAKGSLSNTNYFSTIPMTNDQMSMFHKWLNGEASAKSVEGAVIQRELFRKTFC